MHSVKTVGKSKTGGKLEEFRYEWAGLNKNLV
jgi:hypothetical protein